MDIKDKTTKMNWWQRRIEKQEERVAMCDRKLAQAHAAGHPNSSVEWERMLEKECAALKALESELRQIEMQA